MKRSTAVLLAAGRGTRMKTSVSKQYLELQGMPVFLHSLRALTRSSVITDIVVTVSDGDQDYVWDLIRGYDLDEKVRLVTAGGAERFHSVYNGLRAVDWPCDYAFIHDSARASCMKQWSGPGARSPACLPRIRSGSRTGPAG